MDLLELIVYTISTNICPKYITCSMGCPFHKENRCVLVRINDAPNDEELLKILHEPIDK